MVAGTRFELDGVSLALDDARVLEAVSFTVEPGECVALVGPSGAGKTSLLRLLSTEYQPTVGSARVDGVDVAGLADRDLRAVRARCGFVHQDLALVPELRALQNVLAGRLGSQGTLAGLRSLFWPRRAEVRDVHAILERVGIGELLYRPTARLSGGERQRVAIARSLYQAPRALLADEPIAAVDPARARATIELFLELARERGLTLIVSLHDLDLALEFFPRLIGLRDGAIVFDLETDAIDPERVAELYRLEGRRE